MTILIKGMEMPEKSYKDIHGTLWNRGRFTLTEPHNTLSDYEAVEVPTPHGRLIDADALMGHLGDVEYKGAVKRVLIMAPTVIEAEE